MSHKPTVKRREFVGLCATTIATVSAAPSVLSAEPQTFRRYARVKLVDLDGLAFGTARLEVGESYLFHYPYLCTPCFLIDLGTPTERDTPLQTSDHHPYRWRGGVGPRRSVVAFSAICAHRMSHPARSVSFINYRHQKVTFRDEKHQLADRARVIFCCSEKSVYDPARGAKVLGGPAPQPLAAIELEHDAEEDALYATGTYGGDMFEKFFEKFGHRLVLEYKTYGIRTAVSDVSAVVPVTEFCARQILCGG